MIDKNQEMILIAPHFYEDFKSFGWEKLVDFLSQIKYNVFIKLHTVDNYYIKDISEIAKSYKNIYIVEETNILKYLFNAYCYIGNKSSSIFEFLFFERPIILVGEKRTYLGDIEPFKRIQFEELENIENIIEQVKNNELRNNVLKFLKLQYFTTKDGLSSNRYVEYIKNMST